MDNLELKNLIELKTKDYFSNEKNKFTEWRTNQMITKREYNCLLESLDKNEKMFYTLLNEILK